MWFNFSGEQSYEGSALEQLILTQQKRLDHVDPAQIEAFAEAMLGEHRAEMAQLGQIASGGSEPLEYTASKILASCFLHLMTLATKAAHAYGQELQRIRGIDPLSATVLANCLALYAVMSDLPATQAQGGYRKWFGAYLLFRWSIGKAGLIAPWQKLLDDENLGEDKQEAKNFLLAFFSEGFTDRASRFIPVEEMDYFVLYAHSIASFDPRTPSAWNQLSAALRKPGHAVEGLLATILAPLMGGLISKPHTGSAAAVFPAGDWSHQMAIGAGFTAFKLS